MTEPIQLAYLDDTPAKRLEIRSTSPLLAEDICVACDDMPLTPSAEALVAAGLLPAMRHGRPLAWTGNLDAGFAAAMERYQALRAGWTEGLQCVPLVGQVAAGGQGTDRPEGSRVALFFSGGVDSYYSLLENLEQVTDLVFVDGFDIREGEQAHARLVENQIRAAGAELGKRVICIRTNLRTRWIDGIVGWGEAGHGPAMACVGHLLGPEFRRILIAGSDSTKVPWPWGSHPETDPLWSKPGLEFVHDHREVGRIEKIRRVTGNQTARRHLRVCWKNRDLQANCCRCEKCIRTMISLKALGRLDRCESFHLPLSLRRVAMVRLPRPVNSAVGQLENLKLLKQAKGCAAIKWALRLAFLRCWLLHLFGWHRKAALKKDESAQ